MENQQLITAIEKGILVRKLWSSLAKSIELIKKLRKSSDDEIITLMKVLNLRHFESNETTATIDGNNLTLRRKFD